MRGLKHLSAGAAAAQEANSVLMQELEALRSRLGRVYESESLLKQRVQSLENVIDASVRERESWLVQEDAFLAGLLDEHEQKLFDVERQHERQLAELDLSFDELRRERENARTEVMRLTYERDAAVALLNEPVASTERTPSPSPAGRLGSVKLPPILTSKPELASRPVAGYSLVSDQVDDELDSRPTSRPPRM
jgi:chromosome segregation ATPase